MPSPTQARLQLYCCTRTNSSGQSISTIILSLRVARTAKKGQKCWRDSISYGIFHRALKRRSLLDSTHRRPAVAPKQTRILPHTATHFFPGYAMRARVLVHRPFCCSQRPVWHGFPVLASYHIIRRAKVEPADQTHTDTDRYFRPPKLRAKVKLRQNIRIAFSK